MLYNLTITPQGGFLFSPEGSVTTPPVPPNPPTPPAPPAPQPPAPPPPAPTPSAGWPRPSVIINNSKPYWKEYSVGLAGAKDKFVARIDVSPEQTSVGGAVPQVSWAEAPSNQRVFRKISISRALGDMNPGPECFVLTTRSNTGVKQFGYNDPSQAYNLTTGTWYLNVLNLDPPAAGRCDVVVEVLN